MFHIRPFNSLDCDQIAKLHLNSLPTPFSGRPGFELLRLYYKALWTSKGGCGFVAAQDRDILGYVCGVFAPERIKNYLLTHQFIRLIAWGGLEILTKPILFLDLFNRLLVSNDKFTDAFAVYELRPIVVSPAWRGQGVAQALVSALICDARERGFDRIDCFVEPENLSANRLYLRNNFRKTQEVFRSNKVYYRYERLLFEPI